MNKRRRKELIWALGILLGFTALFSLLGMLT